MLKEEQIIAYRNDISLMIASSDLENLKLFLSKLGEDVKDVLNYRLADVPNPLHVAAMMQEADAVKILLEYGADPNLKFNDKKALDMLFEFISWNNDPDLFKKFKEAALLLTSDSPDASLENYNELISNLLILDMYGPSLMLIDQNLGRWFDVKRELRKVMDHFIKLGAKKIARFEDELTIYAHILGFDVLAEINMGELHYKFKSEGNRTHFSLSKLAKMLIKYSNTEKLDLKVNQSFQTIAEAIYSNDKHLRFITTGWPKHAIYLAIVGDKVILSNRGDCNSTLSSGVKIFTIKDKTHLKDLLGYNSSAKEFEEKLSKVVDIEHPEEVFSEVKSQQHGTCSFVNAKSLIVALLFLLDKQIYDSTDPENDRKLRHQNAYSTYKAFTSKMREIAIDEIIVSLQDAAKNGDEESKNFYLNILKKYLLKMIVTFNQEKANKNVQRFIKIVDVISKYDASFASKVQDPNIDTDELSKDYNEILTITLSPPALPERQVVVATSDVNPFMTLFNNISSFFSSIAKTEHDSTSSQDKNKPNS